MYVLAVSTVTDADAFWTGLKRAHATLPAGAAWKVAVAGTEGTKAINILTYDSVEGVREIFDRHTGDAAITEFFEADAANAVGLPQ